MNSITKLKLLFFEARRGLVGGAKGVKARMVGSGGAFGEGSES